MYDQYTLSHFIGKSRIYITNSLRLLNLPSEVLKLVDDYCMIKNSQNNLQLNVIKNLLV